MIRAVLFDVGGVLHTNEDDEAQEHCFAREALETLKGQGIDLGISPREFIFHVPGLKPPPLGGQLLAWLYARQYLKGKLSLFQHGTNYSRKRSDTE